MVASIDTRRVKCQNLPEWAIFVQMRPVPTTASDKESTKKA